MRQGRDGRVGEEFQIVVRQPVGLMDDRRALGLDADADARPAKSRRAADPRKEVSAVWRMRTMRATPPFAAMPSLRARSTADKAWPASVRNSFRPKAGLTPMTISLRGPVAAASPSAL